MRNPRWQSGWRHLITAEWLLHSAFPETSLQALQAAVARCEQGHDGELRLVIEAGLPWPIWRAARRAAQQGLQPLRERAKRLFGVHQVWDTAQRSGVLLYVLLADRSVEIYADRGYDGRVSPAQWQAICDRLAQAFAAGNYESGCVTALEAVADLARLHFPMAADETAVNELPDRPVTM